MIVIVGQYRCVISSPSLSNLSLIHHRLGVLGYLPPTSASSSADPNLGLLDVINGLQAVQKYVSFFGGDKSKVTIGGQSSGGGIILGAPFNIAFVAMLMTVQVYSAPRLRRACSEPPSCSLIRW
jgi:hypothetical protein